MEGNMSNYGEEIIERLNPSSSLRNSDNPMNRIINNTIGELLDKYEDIELYEQVFLTLASEGYLDLHGITYGVYRKVGESDEDYRQRIIYEIIGELTFDYLKNIYNVDIFSYIENFNVSDNILLSNNPYLISGKMIGSTSIEIQRVLRNNFLIDNLYWINSSGGLDYIIDTNNNNIIDNYSPIYTYTKLNNYFNDYYNTEGRLLKKVNLELPYAEECPSLFCRCTNLREATLNMRNVENGEYLFESCSNLNNINLFLPNIKYGGHMFNGCSSITTLNLHFPKLQGVSFMFSGCSSLTHITLYSPNLSPAEYPKFWDSPNLKYINLTIPNSVVNRMKDHLRNLNLQHLETLIINGQEVQL